MRSANSWLTTRSNDYVRRFVQVVVQIDRRSQARLNAVMGGVLVAVLGGLAWLVLSKPKPDRILTPPVIDLQGQDALRKGLQAERSEKYPEAERHYRDALRLKPGRGDLKLNLARCLVAQGKPKEAWSLYHDVIQTPWINARQKEDDDALAWYADLSFKLGHPTDGERMIALLIPRTYRWPLTPSRALALAHLFGASAASQLRLSGRGHVMRAVELTPTWSFARLALSKIELEAGHKKEAEEQYAAVRRIAQNGSWRDWLLLARYARDHGQSAKSMADFEEAKRRMDRYDTDAWVSCYYFDQRLKSPQNTAFLRKIDASVRPNDPESLLSLAEFNLAYRRDQPSKPLVEAVLRQTSPKDTKRYIRISLLMPRLGEPNRAISILEKTLPYANNADRPWVEKQLVILRMPRASQTSGAGISSGGGPSVPIAFRGWISVELSRFR